MMTPPSNRIFQLCLVTYIYLCFSCQKLKGSLARICMHLIFLCEKGYVLPLIFAVCPVNSQSFISTNRNLLPIENIMSTSESGSNPTANFVNIGNAEPAWCTGGSADTVVGQYVELNFTEPVVIALLMSGGFTSVFVNNFTIHSTMSSTGEDFQPYGILKNPQVCRSLW